MKVTLIQTSLTWQDREKNISNFDRLIHSIKEETDLIVLPEMFTTGFTMQPELFAEPADGPTLAWLKSKAGEKRSTITGSVSVVENNKYYNRLYWVEPDGSMSSYNKRHLFRMGKEEQHYTAGDKKIVKQLDDWRICPLICYDLRFPAWSRNTFKKTSATSCEAEYDVLIYVANWPEVRNYPWKQLLIARAIENQCFVIGVNRIGSDGNGLEHSGDSLVINPRGEIISSIKAHEEIVQTISLDKNYLSDFRKIFPVGLDADDFQLL
jgi:omega-amidase